MKHACHTLIVETKPESFLRLSQKLNEVIPTMGAHGLLSIFVAHTSASLCIQENSDPDVLLDLRDALRRFAPTQGAYRHHLEGSDDMPAHIKTLLTNVCVTIPVRQSKLALGTWQEVYLIEHRAQANRRRIELDFVGT